MKTFPLDAGLAGGNVGAIGAQAVQFFRGDKPDRIVIDGQRPSVTPDWTSSFLAATREARAYWDSRSKQLGLLAQKQLVILHRREGFSTGDEGRALIEVFPFDVCSLGSVFFDEWVEADYRRWSFSRGHYDHGWGCAFRGAGHDRLHSRRWLDFGPWRVIRRPNDTTFIQFHDLGITDPAEAYEQAKVGHQRMGIDPIGGFIQGIDTDVLKEVQGLYRPETKTLEIIVVPGLEVTQQQMRVACGLRLHHRLTKPMVDRVEKIAYVFAAKEDARAHLHELWLRELECWYLDETGKHRLDTEYKPTPQPPAWVKAVEARGD